jgi:hypothetical protein
MPQKKQENELDLETQLEKRTFLNKKEAQGPLLEFQGIRAN